MIKKFFLASLIGALVILAGACQKTENTANSNNANSGDKSTTVTSTGPDNSQVVTTVDPNGVKTETRTFTGNPQSGRLVGLLTRKDLLQVRATVVRAEAERRAFFRSRDARRTQVGA